MKRLVIISLFLFGCVVDGVSTPSSAVIPGCFVEPGYYEFTTISLFNNCGSFVEINDRVETIRIVGDFQCGDFFSESDGKTDGFFQTMNGVPEVIMD